MLDETVSQLPKTEVGIKNAFESCSGRQKYIQVQNADFRLYLEKAKSDLKNIENDYRVGAWDWVIVKSHYSIHHASNAILVKSKNFFSKDHICTILALKNFELITKDLYSGLRKINEKFSDFTAFDITYLLRKAGQYDVRKWKDITKADADQIYSLAKEFVAFVEEACYK